jgi:serine phosphatase RsbU (regulator of sigma subunit)
MGHGVEAALLATLTVGGLRNCRRGSASPAEQADAANQILQAHARNDQFVTGLILRVRLADGHTDIVDAGHPLPFLLRDGDVVPLDLTAQLPLGLATDPYRADTLALTPGDRLLLVTDGYLDRLAARLDIENILARTRDRHPRQIVQELARGVLQVTNGNPRDDATVLCLDWYGAAHARDASGGASQGRATEAR